MQISYMHLLHSGKVWAFSEPIIQTVNILPNGEFFKRHSPPTLPLLESPTSVIPLCMSVGAHCLAQTYK